MNQILKLVKKIRIDSPFKTDYTVKEQLFFVPAIIICVLILFTMHIL